MPTYDRTGRFRKDWDFLDKALQDRFLAAVREFVEDIDAGRQFRSGLRVKGVQGAPGVFEMTFAPNGRATWQYGEPRRPGVQHVIWRRIGDHSAFDNP